MQLQSLLVVGNSLFALCKSEENNLVLTETKYTSTIGVESVLRSEQPDLLIPPEHANNIDVQFSRGSVYIADSEKNDRWIGSSVYGDWVFFFVDTTIKVVIHVQPKVEQYNYKEYVHESDDLTTEEMFKRMDEMIKNKNVQIDDFLKEVDKIAAEVEAMEVNVPTN